MTKPITSLLSLLLLLLAAMVPNSARAQFGLPAPADSIPLTVSFITCGEGRDIYQLEGHAALRLTSPGQFDVAVNWGLFDFKAPNFVYRFVKGETDYMAGAIPFHYFLQEYLSEGRTVVEQQLNLTPEQAYGVLRLVEENLLPENRVYRYNYVKDNCATRPLAIVEKAIGQPLQFAPDSAAQGGGEPATFRTEMARYHANYPWYQFGIDLALGSGIDYPVTRRERGFAPVQLALDLPAVTYTDSAGVSHNLVASTQLLSPGVPGGVVEPPTPWYLTPKAAGWALLLLTVVISARNLRRRELSRWFDSLLYGMFFIAGCIITFLIFVSVHEATSPNWLYLWLNPLCVIPAVGLWIKKCKHVVYWYQICNFVALITLLVAHGALGQALNPAFWLFITCDLIRSMTQLYLLHPQRKAL